MKANIATASRETSTIKKQSVLPERVSFLLKVLLQLKNEEYQEYEEYNKARRVEERDLALKATQCELWETALHTEEQKFLELSRKTNATLANKKVEVEALVQRAQNTVEQLEAQTHQLEIRHKELTEKTILATNDLNGVTSRLATLVESERSITARLETAQQELLRREGDVANALGAEARQRAAEVSYREAAEGLSKKTEEVAVLTREEDRLRVSLLTLQEKFLVSLDADAARTRLAESVREMTSELKRVEALTISEVKKLNAVSQILERLGDPHNPDHYTLFKGVKDIQDAIGTNKGWTLAKRTESILERINAVSRRW